MKTFITLLFLLSVIPVAAQRGPEASQKDVVYGKHERNKMDFWQAKSSKKTPVLIFFHGGGFKMGDKKMIRFTMNINDYLDKGVSCISVNYPFLEHVGSYDKIMKHCEDAIKFIKKNSSKWNIDTKKMACAGSSAGALITQYLGYKGKDISVMGSLQQPMGTEYFSLPHIKRSSPPIMIYQRAPTSDKIHHPKYAQMVKEKCDKQKAECVLYGTGRNGIAKVPDGQNPKEVMMNFFLSKWGMK